MTQESNPNSEVEPNTAPSESSTERPETSTPPTINVDAQPVPEARSAPKSKTPPKSASPKTSASTSASNSESTAMDQVQAVAAELWKQAKPVLQKAGTQALLLGNRATDFLLDKGVPTAKDKVIQVLPDNFKTQTQEKIDPVKAKVVPIWQKVWPWIKKTMGPLWAKAIAFIRSKLPQDLSGQLSDRFLNILVVTTIYLVWSFFSGLTHPSQAKSPTSDLTFPEIKERPPLTAPEKTKPQPTTSPMVAPKVTTTPAQKTEPPKPVVKTPQPSETPKSTEPPKTKSPVVTAPKLESPKVETPKPIAPKPVTPPAPAKPLETVKKPEPVTPKPIEKAPIAPRTPIAPVQPVKPVKSGPDLVALKADLVDSVDRVVEDAAAMLKTVSVTDKQVKLQFGDDWYGLSEKEQSKLVDNLFSKSKKLSYERLDIRDAKNERIARSPYIGDNMIILKRSAQLAKTPPAPVS